MLRTAAQFTAQNTLKSDLSVFMVKLINLYLIHTQIDCQQILFIRSKQGTVYMTPVISSCYAAKAFHKDLIGNASYTAVVFQPKHSQLPIMVSRSDKITVRPVRCHIARTKSINGRFIHKYNTSVLKNLKRSNAFITITI